MCEALGELETDEATKIVVVTGAGESFSAGQDIKLYFRSTEDNPKARAKARHDSHHWRWEKLSKYAKPTIAMVNGYCFGGAFTPLCACDFAIAADEAVFGLSEVNWGILPGGIVSWNVTQLMSYRDAMYYACTGETFTGKQASEMRLVNFSVPRAQLRAETIKFASMLRIISTRRAMHCVSAIRKRAARRRPSSSSTRRASSPVSADTGAKRVESRAQAWATSGSADPWPDLPRP
jgi:feruloyl-CoA hydratase/lyase